ncbi:MAG: hypothetical protein SGI90_13425, partial [Candidatus Eisenbacteria bacterium]|nr:hypothetical protein [Candidatus Eisenbacteria bacterium]
MNRPDALAGLLLLATMIGPSSAAGAGPLRHDVAVMPLDRAVCVGRRFLESGSDSLTLAGRPLRRGIDYTMDAAQGCFFLLPSAFPDSLPPPFTLVVWYRPLPFQFEPVYARRDLTRGSGDVAPPG